jgi:hypothetical protein
MKSLEKQPTERYESARQMRAAIRQIRETGQAPTLVEPNQNPPTDNDEVEPATLVKPNQIEHADGNEDNVQTLVPTTGKNAIKQLQLEYWTQLDLILRRSNSVVRLARPKPYFEITSALGRNVQLYATASVRRNQLSTGIRLLNRRDLYESLETERARIESEINGYYQLHEELEWNAGKRFQTVSEIVLPFLTANVKWREYWPEYLQWHMKTLEAFHKAFQPRVTAFRISPIESPRRSVDS